MTNWLVYRGQGFVECAPDHSTENVSDQQRIHCIVDLHHKTFLTGNLHIGKNPIDLVLGLGDAFQLSEQYLKTKTYFILIKHDVQTFLSEPDLMKLAP